MIVFINQKPVSIFKGALIRDVVMAYSMMSWKRLQKGELAVYDRFGNQTDDDGPVTEGQYFTLKKQKTI